MSLTRKVAYNTGVQFMARFINLGISFATIAILLRFLGTTGYGKFTASFAFVGLFGVFADLGFFTTLVRELATGKHSEEKVVNNIFTLRSAIALGVFSLAIIIAQFVPSYDAEVKRGVILAAISIFFLTLNQTVIGIFQAKYRMDKGVMGDIVGRIVIFLLLFWAVNNNLSLDMVLWIYVIGNFSTLLISFILARKYLKIQLAFDFEFWHYIFKTTISLGFLLIIGTIIFKNDMVILSLFKPYSDIGIYGASYKLFEQIIVLPSMFLGAAFPALASLIADKNPNINRIISKSFSFLLTLALPLTVGGIFYAKEIISLIAGSEFVESYGLTIMGRPMTAVQIFQILSLCIMVIFISNLASYIIVAANEQKRLFKANIIILFINIGLNFIFIPFYSYFAASITTLLTEILLLWNFTKVLKSLGYKLFSFNIILQSSLASAVMLVFAYLFNSLSLIYITPILILIYFVTLYTVGGIDKDVFKELFGRRNE